MWIKELQIKHFGKFTDRTIELSPGINLIYGQNESGKSTVFSFIRGCLYGIRRLRGRASKKDEYSHYQPWDNGMYYAGNLRFVCGEKVFRLERDFVRGPGEDLLVCETDGELLSLENGDLDMLLGGIGEVAFSNTVSIGQLKNETDEGLVVELQNYIANFQESFDQSIDTERAFGILRNKKKELERQNLKEKEKQESRVRHLTDYRGYLSEEASGIQDKLDAVKEKICVIGQQLDKINISPKEQPLGSEEDLKKEKKNRKWIPVPLLLSEAAILVLMYFFCYLMGDYHIMKELLLTMFLLSIVIICGFRMIYYWMDQSSEEEEEPKLQTKSEDTEDENENALCLSEEEGLKMQQEKLAALDKLRWQEEHLEAELEEKLIQIENCEQELKLCEELFANEKERIYKENKEALVMAKDHMILAMQKMQGSTGGALKKRTSEIFSEITGGYYKQVQIDDSLCTGVHTNDRYVPMEQLSKGTIWQVYFAYRMAAGELLTQEEALPIILDDAFVMYDEPRLMQVLSWLSKQDKQVLLFTCQKREQKLLERIGAMYHEIRL